MKVLIAEDEDTVVASSRFSEVDDEAPVTSCFLCLKEVEGDDDVKYCCDQHKAFHRPDEDTVHPFVAKQKPVVGRYLVASRDIEPGELIFCEAPLVLGPNHDGPPTCLDCMRKVDGSYVCPNCNMPMCEEMCAFGEEHAQNECLVFSSLSPRLSVTDFTAASPVYWSITVLRALLLKERDPQAYDVLGRMLDHNAEHAAQDPEVWDKYNLNVVKFLRERCGLASRFTEAEVLHALGAIDVNSVRIHSQGSAADGNAQCPGHALYAVTALLSHACISNSKTLVREDYSCECRATVFILKGQEITKCYVSPLEPTNMRREKLHAQWYFWCTCPRCSDPTECAALTGATTCMRCRTGVVLQSQPLDVDSDWHCDTCAATTSASANEKLCDYFLTKLPSCSAIDDLESLLEKASKLFHPQHFVLTLLRVRLNAEFIRLPARMGMQPEAVPVEVYMRRKELLDEVHKVVEIVEPGLSRRRGISLFEASTCHLQIGRLLHEAGRFATDDFLQLLAAKIQDLKDSSLCLEHSREGTSEASVHYKTQGAIYEAELMMRVLQQRKAAEQKQSSA